MSLRAVAHRGYSARFPENGLPAFAAAIEAGAAAIETDVRSSADGVLVCLHDPDLRRLAGSPVTVAGATLAELRAILGDGRPPRLDEVLDLARNRVDVMLDMKLADGATTECTVAAVRRADMMAATYFGVRTLNQAVVVRALEPAALTVGLLADYSEFPSFFAAGGTVSRVWECDFTEPLATALMADGRPLWVTAGAPRDGSVGEIDAAGIDRLRALGVAAVLLNDPTRLTQGSNQ